MTPLIYFVRHGQTDWNAALRFQGQNEVPLNALGRNQADRNGARLAELITDPSTFDYVSSPLGRARETMERVRLGLGLPAQGYEIDPRLIEVNFGDWQGQTLKDLEAATPELFARRQREKWHMVPPGEGAESYEMLLLRFRPWLQGITRPTVCVAHGGVVRAVFRLVASLDEVEAADMTIPQDQVLRLQDGRLEWL